MSEDLPFNLLIREARLDLGLTLWDVAASVGVVIGTIERWEWGAGVPTKKRHEKLERLAAILQLDLATLVATAPKVTPQVRLAATHCRSKKHLFEVGNYYLKQNKDGTTTRVCRQCKAEWSRKKYASSRGDYCRNDHLYTPENTLVTKYGRTCWTCRKQAKRRGPNKKCRRGHWLTGDNEYTSGERRHCRICVLALRAERRGEYELAAELRLPASEPPPRKWRKGVPLSKPRKCNIDECEGEHASRGLCGKDYERWRKWGNPLVNPTRLSSTNKCLPGCQCGRHRKSA